MKLFLCGFVFCLFQNAFADQITIGFDSGFKSEMEAIVLADVESAKNLKFSAHDPWFQKIFAGGLQKYLDDRINYFVPWTADISGRVWGGPYFPPPGELKDKDGNVIAAMGAYNIGTDLFFVNMKYYNDYTTYYMLRGSRLDLIYMRVGLIELGPRYFEKRDPQDKTKKVPTSRIERLAFLVHEARHSDCTGGLNRADWDRVQMGKEIENKSCGYQHVACPKGHKYEGMPVCENNLWGSYAVETVFLEGVINSCQNCTADEINEAKNLIEERRNRVLNWNDLVSGKIGGPDMTSGGPPWETP